MARDLSRRGVFCNASFPCSVTAERSAVVKICLPSDNASRAARVCEPWGELWQQAGMAVSAWSPSG